MCLIAYSNEPVRHRPANPTEKKKKQVIRFSHFLCGLFAFSFISLTCKTSFQPRKHFKFSSFT
ncbi:Uncharacterized protein APZ42_019754 [Daphnia magna]|uniref:Uncharacterized protein n=1 Tax=Daphnia magna TaxID=35525 RepID=A0A164XPG7_9CRUS|nr:Uncharacterized protein APZ42_019754 [Daphnia magna]